MKDCHLYTTEKCLCYQKPCREIQDCAAKLIIKRNIETVKKILEQ